MRNKFSWKLESFAKGINPNKAAKEFKKVESKFGSLTPENLLLHSKDETSLFHSLFEWDDDVAAVKWRLQQARTIINNIELVVVSDGEERKISAYEIIRSDDSSSYKRIDTFTADEREQVKKRTVAELNSIRNKLSIYKEFDFASLKIEEAVELINEA